MLDAERDLEDQEQDLSREERLVAALAASNNAANVLSGAVDGVAADLQAYRDELAQGQVSEATTAAFEASSANLAQIAEGLRVLDSAFPVADPTPIPAPEEPTEVPPVEEIPTGEEAVGDEPI